MYRDMTMEMDMGTAPLRKDIVGIRKNGRVNVQEQETEQV